MFTNFAAYLANARKAIINIGGLVLVLASFITVPDQYAGEVAGAIAFLTAVIHYLTANADAPGTTPATEDFEAVDADDDPDEPISAEFLPAPVVTAGQVAAEHEAEHAAPPDLTK